MSARQPFAATAAWEIRGEHAYTAQRELLRQEIEITAVACQPVGAHDSLLGVPRPPLGIPHAGEPVCGQSRKRLEPRPNILLSDQCHHRFMAASSERITVTRTMNYSVRTAVAWTCPMGILEASRGQAEGVSVDAPRSGARIEPVGKRGRQDLLSLAADEGANVAPGNRHLGVVVGAEVVADAL